MKKYYLLVIIIVIIFLIFIKNMFFQQTKENEEFNNIINNSWEIKYKPVEKDAEIETLIVKKWENKNICEKYNELKYKNSYYYSNNAIIQIENIDSLISDTILSGFDIGEEKMIFGYIYKIKNISDSCSVAVKFENDPNYYIYINFKYTPDSLLDLINDLNLINTMQFKTIIYYHKYYNEDGIEQLEQIEFENIDNNDIWTTLLYDFSIVNEYSIKENYSNCIISIKSEIPLLGFKNISINVDSDGEVYMNIINSEEVFDISKKTTENFINYIIKKYKGYKIIYENTNNQTISNTSSLN